MAKSPSVEPCWNKTVVNGISHTSGGVISSANQSIKDCYYCQTGVNSFARFISITQPESRSFFNRINMHYVIAVHGPFSQQLSPKIISQKSYSYKCGIWGLLHCFWTLSCHFIWCLIDHGFLLSSRVPLQIYSQTWRWLFNTKIYI